VAIRENIPVINSEGYPTIVFAEMLIDSKPVIFQVDSGAHTNIITAKIVPEHLQPIWISIHNPKNKKKYSVECCVVDDNSTRIAKCLKLPNCGINNR